MRSVFDKLIILILIQQSLTDDYFINNKKFPDNFMFGTATASYQIEGGWDADGKGENIWDRFVHSQPSKIINGDTGDVACDSYHKYEDDIANLKYLGVNHYRFSISWTRILPNGIHDKVNKKGIEYYQNIIRRLKDNNIEPLVTLYHWDLPQNLQDQGGFYNESITNWFTDYVRVCFEHFGEDVKLWITFNEPTIICMGYGTDNFAPGVNLPGEGEYFCMHNLIKAHAAAYHVYQNEFKSKQNGKLTMAHSINHCLPLTDSPEDVAAAEQAMQFKLGWVANPIYYGDYPDVMKRRVAFRSKAEGFTQSRLPIFTDEERLFVINTSDYFAVNVYSTSFAKAILEPKIGAPSLYKDTGVEINWGNDSTKTIGMAQLLVWITDRYNKPDIIITENGLGSESNSLEDDDRIEFVQKSLSRFKDALDQGISVFGYTIWSLMDNFEWNQGYSKKFGVYHVDFDGVNKTRTAKKSVGWYKKVIETRCLVEKCTEM